MIVRPKPTSAEQFRRDLAEYRATYAERLKAAEGRA